MFYHAHRTCLSLCIALALLGTEQADAQQAETAAGITLELSAADDQGGACRMSFVVENPGPTDIDSAVYEAVLFSPTGQVSQLTLLDMKDLPAGRPRVRQFQFAGLACSDISRVLINGAHACQGAGLTPNACIDGLRLTTRTQQEVIG